MRESTVSVGKSGEEKATEYLLSQNYNIIARNFRRRGGEIDIIAKDKDILVFTRKSMI